MAPSKPHPWRELNVQVEDAITAIRLFHAGALPQYPLAVAKYAETNRGGNYLPDVTVLLRKVNARGNRKGKVWRSGSDVADYLANHRLRPNQRAKRSMVPGRRVNPQAFAMVEGTTRCGAKREYPQPEAPHGATQFDAYGALIIDLDATAPLVASPPRIRVSHGQDTVTTAVPTLGRIPSSAETHQAALALASTIGATTVPIGRPTAIAHTGGGALLVYTFDSLMSAASYGALLHWLRTELEASDALVTLPHGQLALQSHPFHIDVHASFQLGRLNHWPGWPNTKSGVCSPTFFTELNEQHQIQVKGLDPRLRSYGTRVQLEPPRLVEKKKGRRSKAGARAARRNWSKATFRIDIDKGRQVLEVLVGSTSLVDALHAVYAAKADGINAPEGRRRLVLFLVGHHAFRAGLELPAIKSLLKATVENSPSADQEVLRRHIGKTMATLCKRAENCEWVAAVLRRALESGASSSYAPEPSFVSGPAQQYVRIVSRHEDFWGSRGARLNQKHISDVLGVPVAAVTRVRKHLEEQGAYAFEADGAIHSLHPSHQKPDCAK